MVVWLEEWLVMLIRWSQILGCTGSKITMRNDHVKFLCFYYSLNKNIIIKFSSFALWYISTCWYTLVENPLKIIIQYKQLQHMTLWVIFATFSFLIKFSKQAYSFINTIIKRMNDNTTSFKCHLSLSKGSTPTVGSSRISSSGSWRRATQNDTRRIWPPLYLCDKMFKIR